MSDQRGAVGDLGIPVSRDDEDGKVGYVPLYTRRTSEYLRAALPLGFEVRRCEEPEVPSPLITDDGRTSTTASGSPTTTPTIPPYICAALHAKALAATNAAWRKPSSVIWLFQLRP